MEVLVRSFGARAGIHSAERLGARAVRARHGQRANAAPRACVVQTLLEARTSKGQAPLGAGVTNGGS